MHLVRTPTHAHRRTVIIGSASSADVNKARQTQGFNSGTTAWFAWAAAACCCQSLGRAQSHSTLAAQTESDRGNTDRLMCVRDNENTDSVPWFDLYERPYRTAICTVTTQDKTRHWVLEHPQNSLKWMFQFSFVYEKFSMCKFIHAKDRH